MAQVYPELQSAFEVFTSKLAKQKPKRKSPGKKKESAVPDEETSEVQTTKFVKKGKTKNSEQNGKSLVGKAEKGVQTKGLANKKMKGSSDVSFAEHMNGDVIGSEGVAKKKKKRTSVGSDVLVHQETPAKSATKKKGNKKSLGHNSINFVKETNDSFAELQDESVVEADDQEVLTTDVKALKRKAVVENGVSVKRKKQKKAVNGMVKVKIEESEDATVKCSDSLEDGAQLFAWLVDPVSPEDFFRDTWEQRPIVIKRKQPDFYQSLVSTAGIHKMLEKHNVYFSKNVDVTSYKDGKRETHNPDGRAFPSVVWGHYKSGCSVRLLNPQTFTPKLHLLNCTLQEYFGCLVGANAYLTPPNSQGFAPHYDDIEAFILQLEGQKHWRLYAPRTEEEFLPRSSSDNLAADDVGAVIMEVTLNPGDLLYFPRGTIHQARTLEQHSLHVTLSCYQRNTWGDLLEKAVPAAVKYAIEEDMELRRGLPLDYLQYMGSVHSDDESEARQAFMQRLRGLVDKLFKHIPVDAAVDQMGKQFMHDALPPVLTTDERRRSVLGDGVKMIQDGQLSTHAQLRHDTRIKLLRANILRLVVEEEDCVRLYHYVDNSLEYHGNDAQYIDIPVESAPAVEMLIQSYPDYIPVQQLPLDNSLKVQLAEQLWGRGLLLTQQPISSDQ